MQYLLDIATIYFQFSTMCHSLIYFKTVKQINKRNNDARRNNFIEFSDFDKWITHN